VGRSDASKHGVWIWCQAPDAVGADASKLGSRLVPGLDWCQAPDAVGADASKLGSGSVPGTCCGAVGC
jgi:hypothetical protein